MKAFDPTKPVQTRDGRPARILCTDRASPLYPIVALVRTEKGGEVSHYVTETGQSWRDEQESGSDLVNIPEKREGWINVYPVPESPWRTPSACIYPTREEAIGASAKVCLATVKVEWTE
jgi:hypothetical protein